MKRNLGNLRSALAHQLKKHLGLLAGAPVGTSAATRTYPASFLQSEEFRNMIDDLPLLHLTNGVTHHLQGEDRGWLSIAIEHALASGRWNIMLSQVEEYTRHFNPGPVVPLAADADKRAMNRFKAAYKAAHL